VLSRVGTTEGRRVQEAALPRVVDALRWRWKRALIVAALFLVGATAYIESLPARYDGTAVVSLEPRPDAPGAGADIVRVVGPKYVAYANAASTLATLAGGLHEKAGRLEAGTNASLQVDTGNLTITVRLPTADRAARAANAVAVSVVNFSETDPLLSSQIVARALPPGAPAAPQRRLFEAAAVVVALLLGTGVSLLLERGRPRIRSAYDAMAYSGHTVLGTIAPTWALRTDVRSAFQEPAVAASFRTLVTNLEPLLGEHQTVAVTSPSVGDGKSTVAALTAEAAARSGLNTLLIDGDFARPSSRSWGIADSRGGLGAVLDGTADLESAIRPGWIDGLSVLPALPQDKTADVVARRFGDVLAEAADRFDVVLVDAPPLLGSADARGIARMVGGVLLVVRAGTPARLLGEALLALETIRAPVLGLVGNRLRGAARYQYHY
jgi:succinoglycan biosynthesis transport protein ExoP